MGAMKNLGLDRLYGRSRRSGRFGAHGLRGEFFFDRAVVQNALGRQAAGVLRYQALLVRRIARQSIRRKGVARKEPAGPRAKANWEVEVRKTPAAPAGKPPFTHTGFLREDIDAALDMRTKSAVIGPWRSPWLGKLHEFGGDVPMTEYRIGQYFFYWRSSARQRRTWRPTGRGKTAHYPARPFMKPALNVAKDKIAAAWKAGRISGIAA